MMSTEFKIFNLNNKKFLAVESARLEECLDFYNNKSNKIYGLSFDSYYGYKDNHLNILATTPQLKGLTVGNEICELAIINHLAYLEDLTIDKSKETIDFERLPKLHTFKGVWSAKIASIVKSTSIRDLALWGFKPKDKTLNQLASMSELTKLRLVSANIESLAGIESLGLLTELSLHYLSKLNNIESLAALEHSLSKLHFENCKKIASYDPLKSCRTLSYISIEKSAPIESLDFTTHLDLLKSIFWVGTKIHCEPNQVIMSPNIEKVIGQNGQFIKGSN